MSPVGICTYVLSQMYSIITNKTDGVELPLAMYLGVSAIAILLMILLSYVKYQNIYWYLSRECK